MEVLIIEDEKPAAEKLQALLSKYDPSINVVQVLNSISNSISWFRSNDTSNIGVIFMDIQLTDGLSFDLFKEVNITSPIIFITAYDEYAIDAFKVNGIDYLLKPLSYTDLSRAMKKLSTLSTILPKGEELEQLSTHLAARTYKDRFMVKMGTKIQVLKAHKIAYCHADGRTLYVHTEEGKKYILDYSLTEIADQLNPAQFYRVNRSYIINLSAIDSVSMFSNSRLKINTIPACREDIIVSRDKVGDFKNWWSGE